MHAIFKNKLVRTCVCVWCVHTDHTSRMHLGAGTGTKCVHAHNMQKTNCVTRDHPHVRTTHIVCQEVSEMVHANNIQNNNCVCVNVRTLCAHMTLSVCAHDIVWVCVCALT